MAASIKDDEFELDVDTDTVKPKNSKFILLKKVEEKLDPGEKVQQDRLEEMKMMILENMKKTIKKKMETRGEKRASDILPTENAPTKPRVVSPTKP